MRIEDSESRSLRDIPPQQYAGKPSVLRQVKQILQMLPEGSPVRIDHLGMQAPKASVASWSQLEPDSKLELHTQLPELMTLPGKPRLEGARTETGSPRQTRPCRRADGLVVPAAVSPSTIVSPVSTGSSFLVSSGTAPCIPSSAVRAVSTSSRSAVKASD